MDVVETGFIGDAPADLAAVRAIADTLVSSVVSVPVGLGEEEIRRAAQALERAKNPRLNLVVPTSAVQMEYAYHRKPDSMRKALSQSAALCVSLCPEVEFTAEDATRSEPAFLAEMVQTAIDAGVGRITLCDSAGQLLPEETAELVRELKAQVPALKDVALGLQLRDDLGLATANALAALSAGCVA